jgi:hypothetical protein
MTATVPTSSLSVERANLDAVAFDLYRDIHKGIRNELFGVTYQAGNVDPGDRAALEALDGRVRALVHVLISHAEHEDEFVQPAIEVHARALGEVIVEEHAALEAQMASLEVLSDRAVDADPARGRAIVHRLYLGLASFTSDYLRHQAFEELEVGPALAAALGPDELLAIDHAIIASIPPEEMATGLSLMIPAMNVEDRTELLGGMQAGAPKEVFDGVMGLTRSLLSPADYTALAARLGVAA